MVMHPSFWRWYCGSWLGIALYFTAWNVLLYGGKPLPALVLALLQKAFLGCLSLLVIGMAQRHPLDRLEWNQRRLWSAQIALCLLVTAVGLAMAAFFHVLVGALLQDRLFSLQRIAQTIPHYYSASFHWILLLELTLAGITHLIAMQRRLGQQEVQAANLETKLIEAQHTALRMQLQPHFLFNTLNSLSTLVHTNPDAADRMIGRLGTFLRMTLDRAPRDLQCLKSELEFIEAYLAIEQIRFRERLNVSVEVPPELMLAQVPSFLLQPLVENALKHGLSDKPEGGHLRVRAILEDSGLLLQIVDDGLGFQNTRKGTGLINIQSRLSLRYGKSASLQIQQAPEGGTQVDLRLPLSLEGSP